MRKKPKAVEYKGFTIREIRPGYFMADNCRRSNRKRKCFNTMAETRTFCEQSAVAVENLGLSAYNMTDRQRVEAKEALDLLAGSVTLPETARFWLRHHPRGDAVLVDALGKDWLADLQRRNCRYTTIKDRRQKVARFVTAFDQRPAVTVTTEEVRQWLEGQGFKAENYNGFRRVLGTMFSFAADSGIVEVNPFTKIKPITVEAKMPVFWPVATVEKILWTAERMFPEIVPSFAIAFFAGLRPTEIQGLQWESVDLTERLIRVTAATSKVRRARLVTITDNLLAWLAPYRRETGPVSLAKITMRRKRIKIMQAAKVAVWPQDVSRHTYASMHYAFHQDAGKLAAEMGHTRGFDLIFKHYRGLVKKTEAARFWAIRPHVESNIIRMEAVGA